MSRHRFALVMLALLVLILFLPALARREVFSLRDHTDYFQPLHYYTSIHLKAFLVPHWNPYSASGEAWMANPQTGVFYPPMWLFAFLPFETAYMLYLALHLVILGWGAYLLFARSVSEPAALVGAVAVTFCGPTLSLLDISNNLATFAWVPWVMWSVIPSVARDPGDGRHEEYATRPPGYLASLGRARSGIFLALAFLGGEPFFALLAALIYVAMVRDWRQIVRTGLVAAGLSAVQLLPFLELLRGSDRAAGLSRAQIFADSMSPLDWLRVAVPPKMSAAAFDPKLSQHFIPAVYIGIPVAILALLALRQRRSIGWLVLLAVAVLVSAGSYLPFSNALFEHLPVTLFRYPARLVPFGALALAALAALAWDRLRPRRRWADLLLVGVILLDLLGPLQPLLTSRPFRTDATYPPFVGRTSKILRMNEGPIRDRGAWIAGYLNIYHRRYDASTAAPVMSERYRRLHDAAVARGSLHLLNLLAVGYVLSERPVPSLQPVAVAGRVNVYATPQGVPMAMFWRRAVELPSPDAALSAALEATELSVMPVAGRIDAALAAAPLALSAVEVLALDSRHARVVVNAPSRGVLVVTQQDAPGWRVFVDGKREEKILAAGVFRAVELAAGRHEVVWKYRSDVFLIGLAMTIITALFIQLSTFVKRISKRKFF
ncbi:MAG TPA: YfhO family protein [Thermoanaerobaculia bacterium]|nr:YfhO family protein [Thermoanaerobaculia bacterium]